MAGVSADVLTPRRRFAENRSLVLYVNPVRRRGDLEASHRSGFWLGMPPASALISSRADAIPPM
eukprot:1810900-Amphidinium_carterae.1